MAFWVKEVLETYSLSHAPITSANHNPGWSLLLPGCGRQEPKKLSHTPAEPSTANEGQALL